MPRRSRIDAAGGLNHVMVRGIEKAVKFRHDADRNHFLERLGKILGETETLCYAWALIPNHLLLRTGPVPISKCDGNTKSSITSSSATKDTIVFWRTSVFERNRVGLMERK